MSNVAPYQMCGLLPPDVWFNYSSASDVGFPPPKRCAKLEFLTGFQSLESTWIELVLLEALKL